MTNKTPNLIPDLEKLKFRLSKAKTQLLMKHPFFGNLVLDMEMSFSTDVPTAATNGKWIKYNPNFVRKLCDEQLQFLLAHEIMHPALLHNWRLKGRNPQKWNMAADYAINQLLSDEGIGKFIEGGCLDKAIYDAGGGYADGIYAILPDNPDGGGGPGGTGSDIAPPDGGEPSEAEVQAQEERWKIKLAQAAQAAKTAGNMSANIKRLVGDILEPQINWKDALYDFFVKFKADVRTFARPNRRFLQHGLYLPSRTGEQLGEVVVAVDCSGSIGSHELSVFAAEINAIAKDCLPLKVHVLYFDSEVCHYDKFERGDDVHIAPHGGGGTAFSPIFKFMTKENIEPVATVVLTDLCCHDFGPAPDHPVLWVTTMKGNAPWGRIIEMPKGGG